MYELQCNILEGHLLRIYDNYLYKEWFFNKIQCDGHERRQTFLQIQIQAL